MVISRNRDLIAGIATAAMLLGGCNKLAARPSRQRRRKWHFPGRSQADEIRQQVLRQLRPARSISATMSGKFSRDGECDDKRFSGPGMTETPLLQSDVGHDATDCRTAYEQKRLTLASAAAPLVGGSQCPGRHRPHPVGR